MKIEIHTKRIIILLLAVLCLIGVTVLPTYAYEKATDSDAQIVTVGYFDLGYYFREDAIGHVTGYDRSYLDKISEVSGLQFRYQYCGTWKDALAMLESGDIDLLGTMVKTDERMQSYQICRESYGYTVSELATRRDREYVYEDYDAIDKSTIGVTSHYVNLNDLNEYLSEHNLHPQIKYYDNSKALSEALQSGEIDIMAANSHAIEGDWNIIEKYHYDQFYFAAQKGNEELTNKIDDALINISLYDVEFSGQMIKRYFPVLVGSPYTKEEYDLIDKQETYIIYLDGDAAPLSWYDEEKDEMEGTLAEVLSQLKAKTGLNLTLRPRSEDNSAPSDSHIIQSEAIGPSNNTYNIYRTDGIYSQQFDVYYVGAMPISSVKEYSVAMVRDTGVFDYIKRTHPNWQLSEYDSSKDCLSAVTHGQADMAYLSNRVADYTMAINYMDSVHMLPTESAEFSLALLPQGEDARMIKSIIDKGIAQIDYDTINENDIYNALQIQPEITLGYLMATHPNATIMTLLLFMIAIVVITGLFAYSRAVKKEKEHIIQSDRAKSEFFAGMSHDMRTPMNGIMGMIDITKHAKSMDEVVSNMEKAEGAGTYMLSLINDALELQRTEDTHRELQYSIVKTHTFIGEIVAMMEPSAKNKNIDLVVNYTRTDKDETGETYVRIDPIRFKQILVNLITNAIKYTDDDGTVQLNIELLDREPHLDHVLISVADTGVGISEGFQADELFKAYHREKNKFTNISSGTGLGLSIVKSLVDQMGGRIEVKSKLGEGTTFDLYMDIETVDPKEAKRLMGQSAIVSSDTDYSDSVLKGSHILLCEDQHLNAEIAQKMLDAVGVHVEWARDGREGLDRFTESTPGYYDALLVDIHMPVMDGLEMTTLVRAMDREDAHRVPIIAMTANTQEADIEASTKAGMNKHLAKPIRRMELYEVLRQMISIYRRV